MSRDPISIITFLLKVLRDFWITVAYMIYWEYINLKHGISENVTCLNGKTAIITGGSSGIGLMTAKLLASRGCRVIIASRRDATKERDEIIKETENPNIIAKRLDLGKFASIRQFAEEIKNEENKLDILINNAGIGNTDVLLTEDGLDVLMQSNYVGHFLLTHLLIDLLKKSKDARIVNLTSGLSVLSEVQVKDLQPRKVLNASTNIYWYSSSKICITIAAQEMAKKLERYGIKVNAVDPGVVRTPIFDQLDGADMTLYRWMFNLIILLFSTGTNKSAQTSFHVAASKDIGTGMLYFRCQPIWKPLILSNKERCREIWQETERIAKLRNEEKL